MKEGYQLTSFILSSTGTLIVAPKLILASRSASLDLRSDICLAKDFAFLINFFALPLIKFILKANILENGYLIF